MRTFTLPAAVALLATTIAAQQFEIMLPRDVLGQKPLHLLYAPASGDFDGDGMVDLVFHGPRVFLNRNSRFAEVAPGIDTNFPEPSASAVGDVDGDGDLDLVQIQNFTSRLFLNDGSGRLVDATAGHLPAAFGFVGLGLALGDIDGDGDLDLLRAPRALLVNDGAGHFADVSSTQVVSSSFSIATSIVARDFDADGDLDFVNMDGLHRNNGSGFFTIDPAAGVSLGYGESLFASDLERDGDLDLLTSQGRAFYNAGNGVFDARVLMPPSMQNAWQFAGVGDLDGDGDDDTLLTPSFANWPLVPSWCRNDGHGHFALTELQPLPTAMQVVEPAIADLDGDEDLDIVAAFGVGYVPSVAEVLYNRGDGVFHNATDNGRLRSPDRATVADIDGDGDDDIVAGVRYRNDGRGSFELEMPPFGATPDAIGVAGDFDGDQDFDLVGNHAIWFNDGTGAFLAGPNLLPNTSLILGASPADLDGDGDVDLVVRAAPFPGPVQLAVFVNDGAGNLTRLPAALPSITAPFGQQALGPIATLDADGDGDQDLFVGAAGAVPWHSGRMLRNDGTGHFTEVPFVGVFGPTYTAEVGDFEGDGDADILTNGALFVNDGAGQFTSLPIALNPFPAPDADDVDGDGDLDIWCTNGTPNRVTLMVNDGSNQFAAAPGRVDNDHPVDPIVDHFLIDVDRDGDRDLVAIAQTAHGGQPRYSVVWWNHAHQLRAPDLTRTGGTLALSVSAIDAAEPPNFVAIAVSLQSIDVPLGALGVLGVDPITAAIWPAVMPAGGGTLASSLAIPAAPSLAGTALFAQALFFAPSSLRLSGTVKSTIVN